MAPVIMHRQIADPLQEPVENIFESCLNSNKHLRVTDKYFYLEYRFDRVIAWLWLLGLKTFISLVQYITKCMAIDVILNL